MEIKPEWWRMGLEYFIWTSIFPLSQNYFIFWTSMATFSQYNSIYWTPMLPISHHNSYFWTSMPIVSHYNSYYWTSMPILSQSEKLLYVLSHPAVFCPGKMTISGILEHTHFQKVCISSFWITFPKMAPQGLSLIHIWRCRRSTLCRSRWSPYH